MVSRGVFRISELNRMLVREIVHGGGVLIAIALISAVGIMSFVAMLTAHRNLSQSKDTYYARCRMADFWVDLKKAPLSDVERLRDVPGIADLRSRIQFEAIVDVPDVARPLTGVVISMPDVRQPVINDLMIRQGDYFSPHRQREVVVSEDFAQARHLMPGDHLRLILNNRRVDLLIVGTAITSEYVYLLPPGGLVPEPAQYGVFWVKRSYAEEVLDFKGACNQVVGILDPSVRSYPGLVLDVIERRLDAFGVFATTELAKQVSNNSLEGEMDGLRTMAWFMPIAFLGVGAVILNTLITSTAERQRTVIGTIKALGYSNAAVFAHYVKFAVIVGLAGSAVGCVFGYLLAGVFTEVYRSQFFKFPDLVNNVHGDILLAGVVIAVVSAVLGAIRGARRLLRLSPAEAMRPAPPKAGHRVAIERMPAVWERLGVMWQAVLRNLHRDRGRSLTGVVAAMIGAALMVTAFYSSHAMEFLVQFQFDRVLVSDYTLVFREDQDVGVLLEARKLPGVHYAEGTFTVACTLRNGLHRRKTAVQGVRPDAVLTVPSDSRGGRVAVPPCGLLLTRKIAELLDVEAGEPLTLVPVRGLKTPRRVAVAGVVDSYLGLGVYADYDWLNRLVGESGAISAVELRAAPGLDERLALYKAVKAMPAVQTIRSARESKTSLVETMLGSMRAMTAMLIGFAGLVYFGSILNSSLISLSERKREVATYRVLGYSPGEVGRIFLRESLVVNLFGALIGLGAGYWLSMAYAGAFDFDTFRFPTVITPWCFAWAWVLALVFTLVAHWPVQRAIHKLDWLGALNIRE